MEFNFLGGVYLYKSTFLCILLSFARTVFLIMRVFIYISLFRLMDNDTTIFSHMVTGLKPFTEYHFRLLVSNSHGETYSPWVSLFTAQDSEFHNRHTRIPTQCPGTQQKIIKHTKSVVFKHASDSTSVSLLPQRRAGVEREREWAEITS